MLYSVFEGVSSLREAVIGMLANSYKINHLGLDSMPKRSTLSDANKRRSSKGFEDIYMKIYKDNRQFLSDSSDSELDLKRLFMMDSTTISLFKAILKAVGRNPLDGKKKGGIKAHVLINAQENTPILVRYSSVAKHDKNFLKHINLALEDDDVFLIFMDIKLPKKSGFEAALEIKNEKPNLPIIAQTAYALKNEIDQYQSVFDDYITKPIDDSILKKVIERYLKL